MTDLIIKYGDNLAFWINWSILRDKHPLYFDADRNEYITSQGVVVNDISISTDHMYYMSSYHFAITMSLLLEYSLGSTSSSDITTDVSKIVANGLYILSIEFGIVNYYMIVVIENDKVLIIHYDKKLHYILHDIRIYEILMEDVDFDKIKTLLNVNSYECLEHKYVGTRVLNYWSNYILTKDHLTKYLRDFVMDFFYDRAEIGMINNLIEVIKFL